jgi:hypothetical protein
MRRTPGIPRRPVGHPGDTGYGEAWFLSLPSESLLCDEVGGAFGDGEDRGVGVGCGD